MVFCTIHFWVRPNFNIYIHVFSHLIYGKLVNKYIRFSLDFGLVEIKIYYSEFCSWTVGLPFSRNSTNSYLFYVFFFRMCAVCNRGFSDPAFVRYPNGVVTHVHCAKNKYVCPVTGKLFSTRVKKVDIETKKWSWWIVVFENVEDLQANWLTYEKPVISTCYYVFRA